MTPLGSAESIRRVRIRAGDASDEPALLEMFDGAVSWLAEQGRGGQWGTEPWSTNPSRVEGVRRILDAGDLWIAEIDGRSAGALVLGATAPDHIPSVSEPERYVHLLLTDRRYGGRGVGRALLSYALDQATTAGVALLRVDCWAGGDQRLVDYYVRAGFAPTETFDAREWPGQVLQRRLR